MWHKGASEGGDLDKKMLKILNPQDPPCVKDRTVHNGLE